MANNKNTFPPIRILFEYSGFLIAGTLVALIWANVDYQSYDRFIHFQPAQIFEPGHTAPHDEATPANEDQHSEAEAGSLHASHKPVDDTKQTIDTKQSPKDDHKTEGGHKAEGGHGEKGEHGTDIHFLISDILMALFFAIAGKEVFESMLPGGALSNPRKAATPLIATLGGIIGPAAIYFGGAYLLDQIPELGGGWAIPCATDIAFSYLVARLIFGNGHPAIAFLLLLAIADDAAGLVILAIFYPQKDLMPYWFLLTAGAVALCFVFRRFRIHSFWVYLLIPGAMCWFSFQMAGIHAALGLVPIIFCMPHAHTDIGIFAREEMGRHDTLNEFEHWWKNPVEIILGLFALVNAGVALSSFGAGTWLVLAGLFLGKPLGITLFTLIAEKVFRLEIPAGMTYRHVVTLGMVAGIGFTVALFVSGAAFKAGNPVLDSVKMGALLSFGAVILAFVLAKILGIRPLKPSDEEVAETEA